MQTLGFAGVAIGLPVAAVMLPTRLLYRLLNSGHDTPRISHFGIATGLVVLTYWPIAKRFMGICHFLHRLENGKVSFAQVVIAMGTSVSFFGAIGYMGFVGLVCKWLDIEFKLEPNDV